MEDNGRIVRERTMCYKMVEKGHRKHISGLQKRYSRVVQRTCT
jgi:hypothetical protein